MLSSSKVAIVGVGNVGSTVAYALMLEGFVRNIALIDLDIDKVKGHTFDLNHCMQFTNTVSLTSGDDFSLVSDADVIVVTAGIAQKKGQNRIDLLEKNTKIFSDIIPEIVKYNNKGILLIVTNPLDVMTYVAWKLSNFSVKRVFGSGTVLDTARLRYSLGTFFNVSSKDISAYILGEHGESEFAWWSKACIGCVNISKFSKYSFSAMNEIFLSVRDSASQIIEKKGATFYAIASSVVKIIRAIILNQPRVFPLSTVFDFEKELGEISLSLPVVIGKEGISQKFNICLNEEEQEQMYKSGKKISLDISAALKFL